jgi:hypothetical protein
VRIDDVLAAGSFGEPHWPTSVTATSFAGVPVDVTLAALGADTRPPPTVVLFLTTDCLGCRRWWDVLQGDDVTATTGAVNLLVVGEGPVPDALRPRDVGHLPCSAPGLADTIGLRWRPAMWVLPDHDVTHSWAGPVEDPGEMIAVVEAVARRARGRRHRDRRPDLDAGIRTRVRTTVVAVDDEWFLYDLDRRRATGLNASAVSIWAAVGSGAATVASVCDHLLEHDAGAAAAGRAVVEPDVAAAMLELLEAGLVERVDAGPAPRPGGPERYVEVPESCCGRTDTERLRTHPRLVVDIGGARRAIHIDEPSLRDELARTLQPHLVDDDRPALDLSIELRPPGGSGPTLWVGGDAAVRANDPAVLASAALGRLAGLLPVPDGLLGVRAAVWTGPDGAGVQLGRHTTIGTSVHTPADVGWTPQLGRVLLDPGAFEVVVDHPFAASPAARFRLAGSIPTGWAPGEPVVASLPASVALSLLAVHVSPPPDAPVGVVADQLAALAERLAS